MGSSAALLLARQRGVRVTLFDRAAAPLEGASRRNEGKIHLGFVYANDPSRRTARVMMRGALCFAPLMRRWLGGAFDRAFEAAKQRLYPDKKKLAEEEARRFALLEEHVDRALIGSSCSTPNSP